MKRLYCVCVLLLYLGTQCQNHPQSQREAFSPPKIGDMAPPIQLTKANQKSLNWESYQGKYLLIDFWASWCAPCRKEHPQLVQAYQKYHPLGLEVLSVSLDHQKEAWLKAIQKDRLVWEGQVSDLKGWENEVARQYGVEAIPANFLRAPNGKIIARDLRGEKLLQYLENVLNSR